MNKKYIQTNIYFIMPIALCFAFYGIMLVNGGPFIKFFIIMLFLGVIPYVTLWLVALRIPAKAEICKIGSIIIFIATALLVGKFMLFTHNAEEAIGLLLLPVFTIVLIWYFILLIPFAFAIVYIRRIIRRKTETER